MSDDAYEDGVSRAVVEMLDEIGATHLVDARALPTLAKVREWESTSTGPFAAIWGGLGDWMEAEDAECEKVAGEGL